jgi:hypothetical protein
MKVRAAVPPVAAATRSIRVADDLEGEPAVVSRLREFCPAEV